MTQIIYLDTFFLVAHYDVKNDRVEISKYLTKFPKLHNLILSHEIEHSKICQKNKISLKHIWIDLRDNFKLFSNPELMKEMKEYKQLTTIKEIKYQLFMILYELRSFPLLFLTPIALTLRMLKKIKTKIELNWLYFSIDRDGFYFELGNIDRATPLFTVAFTQNWNKDIE